mmetsp:Transcript_37010/g.91458  ORF Transcript_37010/g.91458 Transcript_37010/m.91458 type:complete len:248 (-) Transcript_37010:99-842(-)
MTQGELYKLSNLCHLFAHTTHVIISHLIESLFVLSIYGLALAEYLGVRGHNAIFSRVRLHNLELNTTHASACKKGVTLTDGAISFEEIRLQVHVKEIAADALDCITERQHVDALAVFNIGALVDGNDVAEAHPQVLADDFVHADLSFFAELVGQHDAHSVFALLSLDQHGVAAEELKLVHLLKVESHDAVVVVHSLIDHEAVGGLFALEDRGGQILLDTSNWCGGGFVSHVVVYLLTFPSSSWVCWA